MQYRTKKTGFGASLFGFRDICEANQSKNDGARCPGVFITAYYCMHELNVIQIFGDVCCRKKT